MKLQKKMISSVLALCLIASLMASCGEKKPATTGTPATTAPTETTQEVADTTAAETKEGTETSEGQKTKEGAETSEGQETKEGAETTAADATEAAKTEEESTEAGETEASETAGESKAAEETKAEAPAPGEYQYMDRKEVKYAIMGMDPDYVLLDLRKTADREKSYILNTYAADVDAMVSGKDKETAQKNIEAALKEATGETTGKGKKIVLFCYSGKKYAKAAADILGEMGVDPATVYILQDGYKGWTKDDPNGEYQYLIDAVEASKGTKTPGFYSGKLCQVPRKSDAYMTCDDLAKKIEGKDMAEVYVIDLRSASEYKDGHVVTAVSIPGFEEKNPEKRVFVSRETMVANIKAAFEKAPVKDDQHIVLVCRGGAMGAQLMDGVLQEEFGIDNARILTLEGGTGAFAKAYKQYMVKGEEPGTAEDVAK